MWFDDINKKILDGENSNHSNHPEKAWNEMEALLDKHLPQKKKRRRFIFLLLPILVSAGLATFYFLQKSNWPRRHISDSEIASAGPSETVTTLPPVQKSPTQSAPGKTEMDSERRRDSQPAGKSFDSPLETTERIEPAFQKTVPGKSSIIRVQSPGVRDDRKNRRGKLKTGLNQEQPDAITDNPVRQEYTNRLDVIKESGQKELPVKATDRAVPDLSHRPPVTDDDVNTTPGIEATVKASIDSTTDETTGELIPHKKTKNSFGDKFSLTFSVGPDISSIGINNPGRVQVQYGIGVAYAINKNLVIRTGFYAGDKIYDADSANYHMPYPINKLEKVEADCYIYEIPVTLAYNFNRVKKHNWLISGGISSYIMKRETYGYYYKNTWGQPQYYDRTYRNKNNHFLSVIGISGGYQYHFNDRISFLAEPYIKFPVRGIGVGKVKLNNAGVLFTVGYKPFSKK